MNVETSNNGIVNLLSPHSVEGTVEGLASAFEQAGLKIFAQIDQQGAAEAAGLAMRPMTLVIFGNPSVGTQLMQVYPSLAIDLPLKALVWEDANGQVWVSTNSPEYLRQRHGMADAPFTAVQELLERTLE